MVTGSIIAYPYVAILCRVMMPPVTHNIIQVGKADVIRKQSKFAEKYEHPSSVQRDDNDVKSASTRASYGGLFFCYNYVS
jgi:hypothetical protein